MRSKKETPAEYGSQPHDHVFNVPVEWRSVRQFTGHLFRPKTVNVVTRLKCDLCPVETVRPRS